MNTQSEPTPAMPDLADLYPSFAAHWIDTSAGRIFARAGGAGPPLLLLHGYPQTNVIWHKVAPRLAQRFSLVIADLPGYGWSAVPRSRADHAPYNKRAMATAMIDLMEALGYARFSLAGHDRGGRVGYRLALDHPGRLARLAVLDIVPTYAMWHGQDPLRIHATCEDYRAGRTADLALDEADRAAGRMIDCPVLALWGSAGIPSESDPLAVWREWAKDVRGEPIDSGHFPCEENPEPTAQALAEFFAGPT